MLERNVIVRKIVAREFRFFYEKRFSFVPSRNFHGGRRSQGKRFGKVHEGPPKWKIAVQRPSGEKHKYTKVRDLGEGLESRCSN
jgi:hypothetical protein